MNKPYVGLLASSHRSTGSGDIMFTVSLPRLHVNDVVSISCKQILLTQVKALL